MADKAPGDNMHTQNLDQGFHNEQEMAGSKLTTASDQLGNDEIEENGIVH